MAASKEQLAGLIKAFLEINPEPSDAQFHALAESAGVDKETLEAVSYEMLGRKLGPNDDAEMLVEGVDDLNNSEQVDGSIYSDNYPIDKGQTEDPHTANSVTAAETSLDLDVLEDEYDPDTTSADRLAINDGGPGQEPGGFQDEMRDDGVGIEDKGVDVNTQELTDDDGVPVLNATVRLQAARRLKEQ